MKYYLVRYSLESTPGGRAEDINILDIAYEKDILLDRMENILCNNNIESINDTPAEEFEFDKQECMWSVYHKVEGMTVMDIAVYKIIEGEI